MSLIKSISGIRGTIGGKPGDGLSPIDVVKFTTAFATFLKNRTGKRLTLVVGREVVPGWYEVRSGQLSGYAAAEYIDLE